MKRRTRCEDLEAWLSVWRQSKGSRTGKIWCVLELEESTSLEWSIGTISCWVCSKGNMKSLGDRWKEEDGFKIYDGG